MGAYRGLSSRGRPAAPIRRFTRVSAISGERASCERARERTVTLRTHAGQGRMVSLADLLDLFPGERLGVEHSGFRRNRAPS